MKRGWVFVFVFLILIYFLNGNFYSANAVAGNLSAGIGNDAPVLGNVNSSLFVCEGQELYVPITATDSDADSLLFTLTPTNPFFLDNTLFNGQVSVTTHLYSGVLRKIDAGGINAGSKRYAETITISDGLETDTAKTNITVIEINNEPDVSAVGVQTIWLAGDNSIFNKQFEVGDTEDGADFLKYNFSISFENDENLFGINWNGTMYYEPTIADLGIYNISVCVNDSGITSPHANITDFCSQTGSSIKVCSNFSLTITNENRAPNITNFYPVNSTFSAYVLDNLYFNISEYDPDGTIPDAYWYVDGVFKEYDFLSSVDEFTYIFGCGNSGLHTIKADITDGLLNDSVSWNVTLTDCPTTSPASGGVGGGGGGSVTAFTLDKDLIKVLVKQGETTRETLTITNNGASLLNLSLAIGELKRFVLLSEDNLILRPGESKIINADIFAYENEIPDVYTGRIIVTDSSSGLSKPVNVIIEVKEKKPLFDLNVNVLNKEVSPSQKVKANMKMLNMGDLHNIDILVYYAIKDFEGNVLSFREESIFIEKELDIERNIKVPKDAQFGAHVFYAKISYGNITATATDVFMVNENKSGNWAFIISVLILIILLLILAYYLGRRFSNQENQRF